MSRIILIVLLMGLSGCASLQNFFYGTPEQRAAQAAAINEAMTQATISDRQFAANYDDAFRATVRALVDNRFSIRASDKDSGLISAVLEEDGGQPAYLDLWSISPLDESIKSCKIKLVMDISVLVDKINDGTTEIKITHNHWDMVQEVNGERRARELGWNEGINNGMIFNSIKGQIERRQATTTAGT